MAQLLMIDVPSVSTSGPSAAENADVCSPLYFSVVVKTSTAQAGMILSMCGGLGLALGSIVAGQYVHSRSSI